LITIKKAKGPQTK